MNRQIPVPQVHTEGGEFQLDIVDDSAPANEKRWRIVLKDGTFFLMLFDDTGSEHRGLQVKREGVVMQLTRGGVQL